MEKAEQLEDSLAEVLLWACHKKRSRNAKENGEAMREFLYEKNEGVKKMNFKYEIEQVAKEIVNMLEKKNESYGNSALDPIRVFSRADCVEQLKVRIDDKLSRLQRGNSFGEDNVTDLIGYLFLLKIALKNNNK